MKKVTEYCTSKTCITKNCPFKKNSKAQTQEDYSTSCCYYIQKESKILVE